MYQKMPYNFFNRIAVLNIGESNTSGFSISGLRINFEILKTATSESNTCKVIINNLSKNTQNKIRADSKLLLELKVGYTEGSPIETIFVGDIVNVNHSNASPEIETTIEIADGARAIKTSLFSESFAKGSTLRQVIEKAVKKFGLPEKTRLSLLDIPNVSFLSGYAFEGYTADLLDQLCLDNGLQWSVQNNELKIYLKNATDKSKIVKTILIGSPKHVVAKETKSSSDTAKNFTGWEFKTLLLPQAEPGGSILLSSKDVFPEVELKVVEVKHTGDTHGEDWTTSIKGEVL
jgi:hypothetical protein